MNDDDERKSRSLSAPIVTSCAMKDSRSAVFVDPRDPPEARLTAFSTLWKENKDRLEMPKDINYPLNYRMGMRWAARHCDSASAKFAEAIVANTAYISFGEFMKSLRKICDSFKNHYVPRTTAGKTKDGNSARDSKDTVFVLVIPFDMSKSNIWVSLLMYPQLKDILDDIDFDITSVYNRYVARAENKKRIVCIVCDDCAYTGNQLLSYCTLAPHRVEYMDKPKEPSENSPEWLLWDREVTNRVAQIEAELSPKMFSINMLIPYMSTHAQQNISDRKFLMVPRDVQVFKLFRERVNIHDFNQGAVREFESTFQYHSNIAAIYFDHKIADAISTFNKVYLLAPVFGCGNLRQSVCFIDGCCKYRDIPKDVNIYDIYINLEDLLKDRACPPTFYKSIKYTMHGKPVKSLCIHDALSSSREARGKK